MTIERQTTVDIEAIATSLMPIAEGIANRFSDYSADIEYLMLEFRSGILSLTEKAQSNPYTGERFYGSTDNNHRYIPTLARYVGDYSISGQRGLSTPFVSSLLARRNEFGNSHENWKTISPMTLSKDFNWTDRDWLYFMQQALTYDIHLLAEKSTLHTLYPEANIPEIVGEREWKRALSLASEDFSIAIMNPLVEAQRPPRRKINPNQSKTGRG